MQNYTLDVVGSDGKPLHTKIKGPILVTSATTTIYFPLETGPQRVYDMLSHLKPGKDKELWVPDTPSQGGLQAKVGALASLHARLFSWLDRAFNIERLA